MHRSFKLMGTFFFQPHGVISEKKIQFFRLQSLKEIIVDVCQMFFFSAPKESVKSPLKKYFSLVTLQ
jgi:hypothetical protein